MKVEAVKCDKCGKLHDAESDTFATVYGNVTIGTSSGVIGNNFSDDGKLKNESTYCHPKCIAELLKIPMATIRSGGMLG